MPKTRIQTTSRTTSQKTSSASLRNRSRTRSDVDDRSSGALDGHDMVVTTFHLLSDELTGTATSRPTPMSAVELVVPGDAASVGDIDRWRSGPSDSSR